MRREKGKDGTEVYRNTASSLEAELATELNGEKTVSLTHKGKTLSWQIEELEKSSKGEVAYWDDDAIVAQMPGKAKLTAKVNGKTITINVTVN